MRGENARQVIKIKMVSYLSVVGNLGSLFS